MGTKRPYGIVRRCGSIVVGRWPLPGWLLGCITMPCLRMSGLAGSFNSLILFRGVSFNVTRNRHIKLVTGGNAKGAALLGIVTNGRKCSGKGVIFHHSLHISCLRRSPRCPRRLAILRTYFRRNGDAIRLVGRCRHYVRASKRPKLSRLLIHVSRRRT